MTKKITFTKNLKPFSGHIYLPVPLREKLWEDIDGLRQIGLGIKCRITVERLDEKKVL